MGSCLERLSRRKAAEKKKKQKKEEQMSWGGRSGSLSFAEDLKENGGNDQKGAMRVKLVMTKEELQWLMAQIKDQKGRRKSLADVLEEMEKARRKDAENSNNGWKPSLHTIME